MHAWGQANVREQMVFVELSDEGRIRFRVLIHNIEVASASNSVEFCQAAPNRFFGVPAISVYDVDRAIAELKRCKAAGMVGALIWQVPHPDLPFTSDHYERFRAAAADLQMPVCFHILNGVRLQLEGSLEAQRGRSTTRSTAFRQGGADRPNRGRCPHVPIRVIAPMRPTGQEETS